METASFFPRKVINFIENPVISSSFRTTTWILIGAMLFQLMSFLLTTRIAAFLVIALVLTRLVPTILITTGNLPNPELQSVMPGKTAAMFPKENGSGDLNPAGRGVALLILGIKISHPLGYFSPGAKETGNFFQELVVDLNEHRGENGWLGGSTVSGHGAPGENGHLSIIGYFKSMEDLHRFAHAEKHREVWNWWNKNVKNMPHIGVYHEAYDVPRHNWEAVYLQTPRLGIGQSKIQIDGKDGKEWSDVIIDARKGIWRSSAGRMGRAEGKTYDDDPYLE